MRQTRTGDDEDEYVERPAEKRRKVDGGRQVGMTEGRQTFVGGRLRGSH